MKAPQGRAEGGCYNFRMNTLILSIPLSGNRTLALVQGDLTDEAVDAIVNAANSRLAHGGGVAAAIVRKGGMSIQQESSEWVRKHGPVSHAEPAVTGAGRLPCRYVIHAVGPMWGEGDEDAKLSAAVRGSLAAADRLGLAVIALPPISTGIFGFPKQRAAILIRQAVKAYFEAQTDSTLSQVRLTVIDRETLEVFERAWLADLERSN